MEKFIGDAVMALFGAPVAHEDDPERAVRAALAIRDWRDRGGTTCRCGSASPPARRWSRSARGPPTARGWPPGDVVNTAARLQSAAPVNGILVDETTYRATAQRDRVPRAASRSRRRARRSRSPSGRRSSRARASASTSRRRGGAARRPRAGAGASCSTRSAARGASAQPQLVTLVGVPGIGKSRLVAELFAARRRRAGARSPGARAARCPTARASPIWALGEMVKAQAGHPRDRRRGRGRGRSSASVVADVLDGASDAQWVEGHLRPLVGLGASAEHGRRPRGEAFAAWRRFFEALAEQQPARARLRGPALGRRRAARLRRPPRRLGGRRAAARRLHRAARAARAPARLGRRQAERGDDLALAALRRRHRAARRRAARAAGAAGRASGALLARAGGNPLYAEEYVRMLDELRRRTAAEPAAARVGAGDHRRAPRRAPADEKALLQDAAVVGKVFWLGALERDRRPRPRATVEERLHALERKEFVRRERRSSVGERERSTRSATCSCATSPTARSRARARAEKHRLAAEWIESLRPTARTTPRCSRTTT